MDKTYADTVRLLLAVAPDVFANDIFAMKGGTAINLFVRDMPRLSVDIDVVYLPWQTPRDEALQAINQELAAIATRVAPLGVQTRLVRAKDLGDTKLIVENDANQVKIEVNVVFRGSVLPVERRPLSAKTSDLFGVEFELPVLAPDELYASKLVAALDRQHPRDLFDVWQLAALDLAHVRPFDAGHVGQRFLSDALVGSFFPHGSPKRDGWFRFVGSGAGGAAPLDRTLWHCQERRTRSRFKPR